MPAPISRPVLAQIAAMASDELVVRCPPPPTEPDEGPISLHLLAAVNRQGVPLAAAAKMMPKYPQVLVNVPGDASQLGPEVDAAVRRAE